MASLGSRRRCSGTGQPAVSAESITGDQWGWATPCCPVCHQEARRWVSRRKYKHNPWEAMPPHYVMEK